MRTPRCDAFRAARPVVIDAAHHDRHSSCPSQRGLGWSIDCKSHDLDLWAVEIYTEFLLSLIDICSHYPVWHHCGIKVHQKAVRGDVHGEVLSTYLNVE